MSDYRDKLLSLSFNRPTPKTHLRADGTHNWDTDPVKQRIEELSGKRLEIE